MSPGKQRSRPNPIQWLGYAAGQKLPDSMQDWVRNDLTGRYRLPRHIFRSVVPFTPIFLLFMLFPGRLWLRLCMMLLALMLAIFYSVALMLQNRARRLAKHGLPEDLENDVLAARRHQRQVDYQERHGHSVGEQAS